MKQLLTLVLALFIISLSTLEARTYIRDGENVSGSWRKSKSPYIIKGEAIVPKGKTLTIEPGVEVQLKTGDVRSFDDDEFDMGYLRVRGTIKAKGSATRPIKFTRWGSYGNWGAIYLINSKGYNTFKNCIFEHAYGLHDEPECDGWSYGGQLSAFGIGRVLTRRALSPLAHAEPLRPGCPRSHWLGKPDGLPRRIQFGIQNQFDSAHATSNPQPAERQLCPTKVALAIRAGLRVD